MPRRSSRFMLALVLVLPACGGGGKSSSGGQVCGGQQTDTQTDPLNCGTCGHSCDPVLHAAAACVAGTCGQGTCEAGWADLDPNVPGCESPVNQLPSTGIVFDTFASASSFGDKTQTSEAHINVAILGEPTPPPADGAVTTTSSEHENIGGFTAVLH